MNSQYGSRILCVDDDDHSCKWILNEIRFANLNTTVTTVSTGREAFHMLRRETFDLCILEYPLPDMTGVQLCSLIRQMGNDVPVIFFTAMSRPIDMEKAIASGANDFLSKPDDLDRFVPVVKRILQREAPVYLHSIEYLDLPRAA